MLKLQKAANATRQRLARASGLSANLLSETEISYSIIINLINPISLVIGFEEDSAPILSTLPIASGAECGYGTARLFTLCTGRAVFV